ncbi:MAG: hypothetical protein MI717_01225 [Spirochaetales bacterium]|nr:hypothetical protein [Spirochaetales bacterium]
MAVKFQYNKVSMQALQKELKIRAVALPTLKSKEAYLRLTIKKEKQQRSSLQKRLEQLRANLGENERLFAEFPEQVLHAKNVEFGQVNVAGITVPTLDAVTIVSNQEAPVLHPIWFGWGEHIVRELARALAEIDVVNRRIALLEHARKKTTQKVNLYEKVQIPEFSEAVLKIKRYLEDVENLEKAAQKITKSRKTQLELPGGMHD